MLKYLWLHHMTFIWFMYIVLSLRKKIASSCIKIAALTGYRYIVKNIQCSYRKKNRFFLDYKKATLGVIKTPALE